MPLTVTRLPDTFTAVAPVRLVPTRVTATLLPRNPDVGLIEASVGAGVVVPPPPPPPPWVSTAPRSIPWFAEPSGLGLPKKSVAGAMTAGSEPPGFTWQPLLPLHGMESTAGEVGWSA